MSRTRVNVYIAALLLLTGGLTSPALPQDSSSLPGGSNAVSSAISQAGGITPMSSDQIINLLTEKPELVIDLKQVLADRLQAQGIPTQVESITDEMLFGRIATDPSLRSNITIWLRARGYVSEDDLRALQDPDEEAENTDRGYSILPSELMKPPTETRPDTLQQLASDGAGADHTLGAREESGSGPSTAPSANSSPQPPLPTDWRDRNAAAGSQVVHQPTPYNLMALRDLYTQVPEQSSSLKRFGSDIFVSRSRGRKDIPIDLPVGPDYVLGTGDSLNIDLWGGLSQHFTRTIDREGRLVLPEAGPVILAGLTLEQAQKLIQDALIPQFRNARVDVSLTRLRTIRVYVVGDVQRPGAYDISSMSTALNALYAAGGPTAAGSLRVVRHLRGKMLVKEVDLYEFFLHGIHADTELMQSGDTILVPPAGPQVTVSGMVRRPAIYELRDETKLSEVIDLAGGLLVSASTANIKVERIEAHENRVTMSVNFPEGNNSDSIHESLTSFAIQDGDRVTVPPILPYSEKTVYLEGHVVRPGKYPYRADMSLNDLLRSYQDLLPEPADHAEIIRLRSPDYRPETIAFNLPEALIGDDPIHLQPFDTVRIFSRYERDAPRVTVQGEVVKPGVYPLSEGMTVAQLVRTAGGFNRSALLDAADLVSYKIKDDEKVVSRRVTINIGRAVENKDAAADVFLKPGDILTVHQLSGWADIGASVMLSGEVAYPGMYGVQQNERLSSVIRRAGGFRTTAYPAGAILVRQQVKELEEKSRAELIRQLESAPAGAKVGSGLNGQDMAVALQLVAQQQQQTLQRLKSQPVTGRLVIKINADVASWENTAADIELRAGDVITIPKQPGFVLVSGQVYNTAAVSYVPGKTAGWYLRHAGGPTEMANKKEIFVVRANGAVVGRHSGEWYDNGVLDTRMGPGDVVVVPQKILGGSPFWRNLLATAQVMSSIAITAKLAGF